MRLLGEIFTYLALASLWNLLAGSAGLVSVGQQAFVGFGGYMLFAFAIFAGLHPLLAIVVAGVLGALRRGSGGGPASSAFPAPISPSAPGSSPKCSGSSSPKSPRSAAAPARACRRRSSAASPKAATCREWVTYWAALALAVLVLALAYGILGTRGGMALAAIRDSEIASESLGVRIWRTKLLVYVAVGGATAMVGALIFLQKLRISPDAAFSVNDWTAYVIFITVIGGIGTIEGPIVGTIVFFLLRETLADLGSIYLMILGAGRDRRHAEGAARHLGICPPALRRSSSFPSTGGCATNDRRPSLTNQKD